MANFNWPSITTSSAPIQYNLNGTPTTVSEDTVTPANSRPLPVKILGPSGGAAFNYDFGAAAGALRTASLIGNVAGIADFGSGTVSAQTLRTALASDQLSTLSTATLQTTGNNTLTTISGKLPATLGQKAMAASLAVTIASDQSAFPVTVSGVATEAKQDAQITLIGALTETAPATDTASSGLNGRLQRIAQRLTSLIALFPTTIGQKTGAGSLSVVLASDQAALPASQIPIATGSVSQQTVGTSAVTFTAPAGAVGFKIQSPSTNTDNINFNIGTTATITNGILMEPGRSETFDTGSNISVIAGAAAQTVTVLWRIRP